MLFRSHRRGIGQVCPYRQSQPHDRFRSASALYFRRLLQTPHPKYSPHHPHLPESNEQNLIVIEAFLEAAKRYARGGYDVIVDGIVGPWFLEPWLNIVQEHYEVHYIVLRASKEETIKRAIERSKLDRETNIELVETMWKQFSNLGIYELNVIDTTTHSIKDTVSAVKEKIVSGTALLF